MDLAMQIFSSDKTVTSDTKEGLKEFNSQSSTTQAKKRKKLVSMMPTIKRAFNLLGDHIVEIHTQNESLKNEKGSYEEEWLEVSETKPLKHFDDERRAKLIMSRMKKQMNKN